MNSFWNTELLGPVNGCTAVLLLAVNVFVFESWRRKVIFPAEVSIVFTSSFTVIYRRYAKIRLDVFLLNPCHHGMSRPLIAGGEGGLGV